MLRHCNTTGPASFLPAGTSQDTMSYAENSQARPGVLSKTISGKITSSTFPSGSVQVLMLLPANACIVVFVCMEVCVRVCHEIYICYRVVPPTGLGKCL